MGVVYKIKDEILQFIIAQKKTLPTTSCRKLSTEIEKQFHTKISKSSVNAILKNAHLSSPVGRPLLGHKRKLEKFKLPEALKKDLFSPNVEFLFQETGKDLSAPKDQDTLFLKKSGEPPASSTGLVSNMGYVFFKAAEWELSGESILGNKFVDLFHFDVNKARGLAENLMFRSLFGLAQNASIPRELKEVFFNSSYEEDINNLLFSPEELNKLCLGLSIDFHQMATYANKIVLVLANGQEVQLDSNFTSFCEKEKEASFYIPINNVLTNVSTKIINNAKPAVLCYCPISIKKVTDNPFDFFHDEFKNFWAFFEDRENFQVKQININDRNGQNLFVFDNIIKKRRSFISAIWSSQEEFHWIHAIYRGEKILEFESDIIGRKLFFSEHFFTVAPPEALQSQMGLRIFLLRIEKDAMPFAAVFTNSSQELFSAQKAIEEYFMSWPDGKGGFFWDNLPKRTTEIVNDGAEGRSNANFNSTKIIDVINRINNFIYNRSQDFYFPASFHRHGLMEIIKGIYALPGREKHNKDLLEIFIKCCHGYVYENELRYATRNINERDIRDFSGRKVIVRLEQ